ncbi:MAG: hypothetical protein AAB372_00190 [Patescibacteria group bacterium]
MRYADAKDFQDQNGYIIDGVWYPRVTRILEVKSKPGLQGFFIEMGSFEAAEAVKNKSAEHGSLVHEVVQSLAVGNDVEVPEEVRPAAEAFREYYEMRGIHFHPEYIEKQVWSGIHRYAGTVDALAEIDGKFGVLDIKTSIGFYPEYNLQTAAYVQALTEPRVRDALGLPRPIETRWILRIDQYQQCTECIAKRRDKGGRVKIRSGTGKPENYCKENEHTWGPVIGDIELREFPYFYYDIKAFNAAKTLWEWENNYWLRNAKYLS